MITVHHRIKPCSHYPTSLGQHSICGLSLTAEKEVYKYGLISRRSTEYAPFRFISYTYEVSFDTILRTSLALSNMVQSMICRVLGVLSLSVVVIASPVQLARRGEFRSTYGVQQSTMSNLTMKMHQQSQASYWNDSRCSPNSPLYRLVIKISTTRAKV